MPRPRQAEELRQALAIAQAEIRRLNGVLGDVRAALGVEPERRPRRKAQDRRTKLPAIPLPQKAKTPPRRP